MPALDYSRFAGIGDSGSESGDEQKRGLPNGPDDLQGLIGAVEAERRAKFDGQELSSLQEPSRRRGDRVANAASQESPSALERFVELAAGTAEASKGEDIMELVAAAKAIVQSSLAAEESRAVAPFPTSSSAEYEGAPPSSPSAASPGQRLAAALRAGLQRRPSPTQVAREQAPEFVAELLVLATSEDLCESAVAGGSCSSSASPQMSLSEESEEVLRLLAQQCRAQEIYTFLMEALYSEEDLPWAARSRGVQLLEATLLAMEIGKRIMFLSSCLPMLLKRCLLEPPGFSSRARGEAEPKEDQMSSRLMVIAHFAKSFANCEPGTSNDSTSQADVHSKAMQSMVSGFLFKVAQKLLPALLPVAGLEIEDSVAEEKEAPGGPLPKTEKRFRRLDASSAVRLRFPAGAPSKAALLALSEVAKAAAATSPRPLLALLEEMDLGDPTGDGGGDLEVSPLCLASVVSLLELEGAAGHFGLVPQVLPLCLSPARRANILMRSCFVLLCNCDAGAPNVVSLGDLSGPLGDDGAAAAGHAAARRSPCYAQRGLSLFTTRAAPLLLLAAKQSPEAFAALAGPLCRWHPSLVFRKLLESLAATPDMEQEARGAAFRSVAGAMKVFHWPSRCQLYLGIISDSRVDAIIGAVVTLFKDDWWPRVQDQAAKGVALAEERAQLVKVLTSTLSGDVQIIDGMDTLTAALNIARLVALARSPAAAFLRCGLRRGGPSGSIDLEAMLNNVSKQIDAELGLLQNDHSQGSGGLSQELAKAMGAALGEGADGLTKMKRERINMVAHLVSRVREVLCESPE